RRVAHDGAQHVARLQRATVQAALGDASRAAQAVLSVERKHPNLLVVELRKADSSPSRYLVGRGKAGAWTHAGKGEAPAQLEPRGNPRRLGQPHPRSRGERVRAGAVKATDSAALIEKLGSYVAHRSTFLTGPEQDGDELRVGQRFETERDAAFARTRRSF